MAPDGSPFHPVPPTKPYMAPMALMAQPEAAYPSLCQALQKQVNEIVESRSVARRLLTVMRTGEAVPTCIGMTAPEPLTTGVTTVSRSRLEVKGGGVLLWGELVVDLVTAQLLDGAPERAELGAVARVAEDLVAHEDAEVLAALEQAAQRVGAQNTIRTDGDPAEDLLAAAESLRQGGRMPALALVVWGALRGTLAQTAKYKALRAVFSQGIFPAEAPPGSKNLGLILDPASANAKLVVGKDYEVVWLGWEGPAHKVGVALGFAASIGESPALRLLVP